MRAILGLYGYESEQGGEVVLNPSPSFLDLSQTTLTLKVNGDVVYNSAALTSKPIVSITLTDGRTLITSWVGTNTAFLQIAITGLPTLFIYNSIALEITITSTGFKPYSNNLTLYGYDIGFSAPGTDNYPLNFYLLANNQIECNYPDIIRLRKPFTDKIYFYKNSSSSTPIQVFDGSLLKGVDSCIVLKKEDFTFTLKNEINNISYNLGNFLIQEKVYQLDFNSFYNVEGNALSLNGADEIETSIGISAWSVYNVNGVSSRRIVDTLTLVYRILDINANEIDTKTIVLNPYTFTSTDTVWNDFEVPSQDTYILETTLMYGSTPNLSGVSEKKLQFLYIRNWATVAMNNDWTYSLYNNSSSVVTITITDINSALIQVFENIQPFTNVLFSPSVDNVFMVEFKIDDANKIFIPIVHFNNLKECLLPLIQGIICGNNSLKFSSERCEDSNSKDYYSFMNIIINSYTLFNLINSQYITYPVYKYLTPNLLSDLFTVKDLLDRLKSYCTNCIDIPNCNCS